MEINGNSWKLMEYNLMECSGMLWNVVEYSEI